MVFNGDRFRLEGKIRENITPRGDGNFICILNSIIYTM